jgi:hypothetical protein
VTFKRTARGLSNQYLFLRVDAVIYTEGGRDSLACDAVLRGGYNRTSLDAKFWHALFRLFVPDRTFAFRSVGSKTTVTELAALIAAGEAENIVVCMDRDLDDFTGARIAGARILYSRGYSWENDVWVQPGVFAVVKMLSTNVNDLRALAAEIREKYASFERTLYWTTYIHYVLASLGLETFAESDWQRTLLRRRRQPPRLDRRPLLKKLSEIRERLADARVFSASVIRVNTLADCHGHLVGDFGYHMLQYLLMKYADYGNISREIASALAIEAFANAIAHGRLECRYYRDIFSLLPWGAVA